MPKVATDIPDNLYEKIEEVNFGIFPKMRPQIPETLND